MFTEESYLTDKLAPASRGGMCGGLCYKLTLIGLCLLNIMSGIARERINIM